MYMFSGQLSSSVPNSRIFFLLIGQISDLLHVAILLLACWISFTQSTGYLTMIYISHMVHFSTSFEVSNETFFLYLFTLNNN